MQWCKKVLRHHSSWILNVNYEFNNKQYNRETSTLSFIQVQNVCL